MCVVYVHIEVCSDGYDVHMHVIHVEVRDPYQESSLVSPNLILLRQFLSLNLELSDWLDWLASEL